MRIEYSSKASASRARRPASLWPLMNHCTFFGSYFSVSTFSDFISRLIADSWSALSRIWNDCGSPASRQCVRSSRLARPWKVPTHMPRVLIGSIAEMRVSISFAALLVKVTARMPCGDTCPVWISHTMRVVSTRVLPEPAPARISADSCGSVTAARCSGLRFSSRWADIRG
jgi:hypothetical protein